MHGYDAGALTPEMLGRTFAEARPADAMIVVTGFVDPRWRVEIEVDAILDQG